LAVVSGARWWERMGAAFLATILTAPSTHDLDPAAAASVSLGVQVRGLVDD